MGLQVAAHGLSVNDMVMVSTDLYGASPYI